MKKKYLILLLYLFISRVYAGSISLVAPVNDFNSPSYSVNFVWNAVTSQSSYRLIIAQDQAFTNIINNIIVAQTHRQVSFSNITTKIYWKVITASSNGYMESDVFVLNFMNPSQINSVSVWLAADSNLVLNPDSTISAWNNIKPNGISATQAIPNKQAKLSAQIPLLNNKRTVRFDGFDDTYTLNGGGNIGSLFAILNFNSATFPDFNNFLSKSPVVRFDDYFLIGDGSGGRTTMFPNQYFGQGAGSVYVNKVLPSVPLNLAPPPTSLSTHKIFTGIRNIGSILNCTNFNLCSEGSSRYWNGDATEIIITESNSLFQKDSIETYLQNKYAPPLALSDTVIGSSFCSNVTIPGPNNYVSYLWSTGSTSSAVNVPPNKIYSLTVKDVFGYSSTAIFSAFPYRRLNNATVYICQGDTFKLDLKTPAGFSAAWTHGPNTSKINITQSGQYTVIITDGASCSVRDTINVIVDNPTLSPTPDVSNNLRVCLNEKLFLTTSISFDSIRWSTGSNAVFLPISTAGSYSVYGKTKVGCVVNKSFNVAIIGNAPTAKFGYTSACEGVAVNFKDSSIVPNGNNIQSWKWNFSNNTTSNLQNPSVTFPGLGIVSASLKVTTNVGCTDSIFKSFVVNKKPIPSFYNLLSCSGNPTTFVDQSLANAASVTDWAWDFNGLGISNGIPNPSFRFPVAGTYNVRLMATNSNGCSDTITLQTEVNSSPISAFSFDSVCGKTPVKLKFLATVDPPSTIPDINWGKWDFGDGSIETAIRNPQHEYATPGTYDVSLIVISSNQCADTQVNRVKVFNFPVVDFTNSQTQCVGKEIQFTDISNTPDGTPVTKWNWFFSGQGTSEEQNPRFTFNSQGNYTIQLTAKNEVGCTGTKLRSIAVSSPPTPAFTFSPQNGLPPLNVNYFNQSPVNGNYLWDYGDGSPLVEAYTPAPHIYTVKGTYPIKLVATDFRGCTDTLTKFILVDKAFLDGIMASISIIPNGDFYKVQVSIINNSNIEITALGLSIQLGGGALIRENWTGSLLPGQTTVYLFTGEIKVGDNGQIPVICASIDNINNNALEDRIDNNTTCKEVSVGNFDILNIYPNPAYETINFGVMLPKDGRVNIRFIGILGQQMYSKDFDGVKGYNKLTISTMPLNAAVYVAEVSFDGIILREKFMRKDRK